MANEVSLREYVDQRFDAADKAVAAALAAQEKAILKAEASAEERFKLLNELRTGVATRDYVEAIEKVNIAVSERVTKLEGQKQGSGDTWKVIVTIISVTGTGIGILVYLGIRGV